MQQEARNSCDSCPISFIEMVWSETHNIRSVLVSRGFQRSYLLMFPVVLDLNHSFLIDVLFILFTVLGIEPKATPTPSLEF